MGKTGNLLWPNIFNYNTTSTTTSLFNDGQTYSIIFQQPENATIDTILLNTLTYSGTGFTYSVGFQGVGATGYPDGNYLNSGTAISYNGPFNYTSSVLNFKMPAGVALTGGNFYSIVVKAESGHGGTRGMTFEKTVSTQTNALFITGNLPYFIENNAKTTGNSHPKFGYRSSNKTYGFATYTGSTSSFSIRSNTDPDEIGFKWSLNKSFGAYYYVSGVRLFYLTPNLTNGNYSADIIIYDSDGSTALQSARIAMEQRGENATPKTGSRNSDDMGITYFQGNLAKLKTGKQYYLGFRPNDILNGATFYTFYSNAYDNPDLDYNWLNDTKIDIVFRTDAGIWNTSPTLYIPIQFYINTVLENSKIIITN